MFKIASQYPITKKVEKFYKVIQEELLFVLSKVDLWIDWKGKEYDEKGNMGNVFGSMNDAGLTVIGLKFWNRDLMLSHLFPKTMRILKGENVSFVMFSKMRPFHEIEPHKGYNNGVIRCSMPVIAPSSGSFLIKNPKNIDELWAGRCAVGGSEIRESIEGKCMAFDDAQWHFAWNNTDQEIIKIIFDIGENYRQTRTDEEIETTIRMHDRIWRNRLEDASRWAVEPAKLAMKRSLKSKTIDPNKVLGDQGLDSIGAVNLLLDLGEELSLRFDEDESPAFKYFLPWQVVAWAHVRGIKRDF